MHNQYVTDRIFVEDGDESILYSGTLQGLNELKLKLYARATGKSIDFKNASEVRKDLYFYKNRGIFSRAYKVINKTEFLESQYEWQKNCLEFSRILGFAEETQIKKLMTKFEFKIVDGDVAQVIAHNLFIFFLKNFSEKFIVYLYRSNFLKKEDTFDIEAKMSEMITITGDVKKNSNTNFNSDLLSAQKMELEMLKILIDKFQNTIVNIFRVEGKFDYWDFVLQFNFMNRKVNITFECKNDIASIITNNIFFEINCNKQAIYSKLNRLSDSNEDLIIASRLMREVHGVSNGADFFAYSIFDIIGSKKVVWDFILLDNGFLGSDRFKYERLIASGDGGRAEGKLVGIKSVINDSLIIANNNENIPFNFNEALIKSSVYASRFKTDTLPEKIKEYLK